METQLVIFLAFTSVTVITNTLLMLFVYRAIGRVTNKVTRSIREFEKDAATRAWITELLSVSENAVTVTSDVRHRIQDLDPVLIRTRDKLGYMLAKIDKNAEDLAEDLAETTTRMRDSIARPAFNISAFAAGLHGVLGVIQRNEEEDRP
jgi:hypothetical protein